MHNYINHICKLQPEALPLKRQKQEEDDVGLESNRQFQTQTSTELTLWPEPLTLSTKPGCGTWNLGLWSCRAPWAHSRGPCTGGPGLDCSMCTECLCCPLHKCCSLPHNPLLQGDEPRHCYFQTGCARIAKIQEFKKCRAFCLGAVTRLRLTLPCSAAVPICTLCLVFYSYSETELVSRKF